MTSASAWRDAEPKQFAEAILAAQPRSRACAQVNGGSRGVGHPRRANRRKKWRQAGELPSQRLPCSADDALGCGHAQGGVHGWSRIGRQFYDVWALLGTPEVLTLFVDRTVTGEILASCFEVSLAFVPDKPVERVRAGRDLLDVEATA